MKNDQHIKTTLKPITEGLVVEPSEVGFIIFGGSMQNSIVIQSSLRVSQLSALLQNSVTVLPVFVRFQKVDQYLTIPVMDVIINGNTVEVHTTEGLHSISMESLIDIVVFQDASGKPVFLTEFSTGENITAEFQKEIEDAIEYQIDFRLKYQDVYLPANCGRSISRLMIRKQKKTGKDYSDVVEMSYDNRLAA